MPHSRAEEKKEDEENPTFWGKPCFLSFSYCNTLFPFQTVAAQEQLGGFRTQHWRTIHISPRCGFSWTNSCQHQPLFLLPPSEGEALTAVMGMTTRQNGCVLFSHNLYKENTYTHVGVIPTGGEEEERGILTAVDTKGQSC